MTFPVGRVIFLMLAAYCRISQTLNDCLDAPRQCPSASWIPLSANGKCNCYLAANATSDLLPWELARERCREYGAHLVVFNSLNEFNGVKTLLASLIHSGVTQFYVGYNNAQNATRLLAESFADEWTPLPSTAIGTDASMNCMVLDVARNSTLHMTKCGINAIDGRNGWVCERARDVCTCAKYSEPVIRNFNGDDLPIRDNTEYLLGRYGDNYEVYMLVWSRRMVNAANFVNYKPDFLPSVQQITLKVDGQVYTLLSENNVTTIYVNGVLRSFSFEDTYVRSEILSLPGHNGATIVGTTLSTIQPGVSIYFDGDNVELSVPLQYATVGANGNGLCGRCDDSLKMKLYSNEQQQVDSLDLAVDSWVNERNYWQSTRAPTFACSTRPLYIAALQRCNVFFNRTGPAGRCIVAGIVSQEHLEEMFERCVSDVCNYGPTIICKDYLNNLEAACGIDYFDKRDIPHCATPCPSDSLESPYGTCYHLSSDVYFWSDAQTYCNQRASHIVSIHSADENMYILQNFRLKKDVKFWIGAMVDKEKNIPWWTDGTQFNYAAFSNGGMPIPNAGRCVSYDKSDLTNNWVKMVCDKTKLRVLCFSLGKNHCSDVPCPAPRKCIDGICMIPSIENESCNPNPCRNDGRCNTTTSGGFVCLCQEGFTSVYCEKRVNIEETDLKPVIGYTRKYASIDLTQYRACPNTQWFQTNTSCYYVPNAVVTMGHRPWEVGREMCRESGAHLLVINGPDEADLMRSLQPADSFSYRNGDLYQIGYQDTSRDLSFVPEAYCNYSWNSFNASYLYPSPKVSGTILHCMELDQRRGNPLLGAGRIQCGMNSGTNACPFICERERDVCVCAKWNEPVLRDFHGNDLPVRDRSRYLLTYYPDTFAVTMLVWNANEQGSFTSQEYRPDLSPTVQQVQIDMESHLQIVFARHLTNSNVLTLVNGAVQAVPLSHAQFDILYGDNSSANYTQLVYKRKDGMLRVAFDGVNVEVAVAYGLASQFKLGNGLCGRCDDMEKGRLYSRTQTLVASSDAAVADWVVSPNLWPAYRTPVDSCHSRTLLYAAVQRCRALWDIAGPYGTCLFNGTIKSTMLSYLYTTCLQTSCSNGPMAACDVFTQMDTLCGVTTHQNHIYIQCNSGLQCPMGFEFAPYGACYRLGANAMYFSDARTWCQSQLGELVSIHSQTEDQYLLMQYRLRNATDFWIGLLVEKKQGLTWWSDGSFVNYANWVNGKPEANQGPNAVYDRQLASNNWLVVDSKTKKNKPLCMLPSKGSCFGLPCIPPNVCQDDVCILPDIQNGDPCKPMPCRNGGVCTSTTNSFTCQCNGLFRGVLCERASREDAITMTPLKPYTEPYLEDVLTRTDRACPSAWFRSGNSCYQYANDILLKLAPWETARETCREFGGHLAVFETPDELNNLRDFLPVSFPGSRNVLLGYQDSIMEGELMVEAMVPIWANNASKPSMSIYPPAPAHGANFRCASVNWEAQLSGAQSFANMVRCSISAAEGKIYSYFCEREIETCTCAKWNEPVLRNFNGDDIPIRDRTTYLLTYYPGKFQVSILTWENRLTDTDIFDTTIYKPDTPPNVDQVFVEVGSELYVLTRNFTVLRKSNLNLPVEFVDGTFTSEDQQVTIYLNASRTKNLTMLFKTVDLQVFFDGKGVLVTVNHTLASKFRLGTGLCGRCDDRLKGKLFGVTQSHVASSDLFAHQWVIDAPLWPSSRRPVYSCRTYPLMRAAVNRCRHLWDLTDVFGSCLVNLTVQDLNGNIQVTHAQMYENCLNDVCLDGWNAACRHFEAMASICGMTYNASAFNCANTCPPGFNISGLGICYLLSSKKYSWSLGETFCHSKASHLVSIHSYLQNKELAETYKNNLPFWIGMLVEPRFLSRWWSDGSPVIYGDSWYKLSAANTGSGPCTSFAAANVNASWRMESCKTAAYPVMCYLPGNSSCTGIPCFEPYACIDGICTDQHACNPTPCLNDGKCELLNVNAYRCVCTPDKTGRNCDKPNACYPSNYCAPGQCIPSDDGIGFACNCTTATTITLPAPAIVTSAVAASSELPYVLMTGSLCQSDPCSGNLANVTIIVNGTLACNCINGGQLTCDSFDYTCPPDSLRNNDFLCYTYNNTSSTWKAANDSCMEMKCNLPTPKSAAEYMRILNVLQSFDRVWLGGCYNNEWTWNDGTIFNYTSWDPTSLAATRDRKGNCAVGGFLDVAMNMTRRMNMTKTTWSAEENVTRRSICICPATLSISQNVCFPNNPCKNNGICVRQSPTTFACICPSEYTGQNCVTKKTDICKPSPCFNGGVCTRTMTSFTCTCRSGYSGQLCDKGPPSRDNCVDYNCCFSLNGWVHFQGACYYLNNSACASTYWDSQVDCRDKRQTHLIRRNNSMDVMFISKLMSVPSFWIHLNNLSSPMPEWDDFNDAAVMDKSLQLNSPMAKSNLSQECPAIQYRPTLNSFDLNWFNCYAKQAYACEMEKEIDASTTGCQDGWVMYDTTCFGFYFQAWVAARAAWDNCRSVGAVLAAANGTQRWASLTSWARQFGPKTGVNLWVSGPTNNVGNAANTWYMTIPTTGRNYTTFPATIFSNMDACPYIEIATSTTRTSAYAKYQNCSELAGFICEKQRTNA